MNNSKIRESLMQIKLSENAQDRIYQNILKKAEASSKPRHTMSRILVPMAACLLLVLGISLWTPRQHVKPQKRPVAVVSPVLQVDGAEALSPAGVFLDAPEGAEDVSYYLISNQVAKIHFTLHGIEYDYMASAVREDDFTFVADGTNTETVQGNYPGHLSLSPEGVFKGELEIEGAKAYILNYSGAEKEQMEQLLRSFSMELLK